MLVACSEEKRFIPTATHTPSTKNPQRLLPKEERQRPVLHGNTSVVGTTECRIMGLRAAERLKSVTNTNQQRSCRTIHALSAMYTVMLPINCLRKEALISGQQTRPCPCVLSARSSKGGEFLLYDQCATTSRAPSSPTTKISPK